MISFENKRKKERINVEIASDISLVICVALLVIACLAIGHGGRMSKRLIFKKNLLVLLLDIIPASSRDLFFILHAIFWRTIASLVLGKN